MIKQVHPDPKPISHHWPEMGSLLPNELTSIVASFAINQSFHLQPGLEMNPLTAIVTCYLTSPWVTIADSSMAGLCSVRRVNLPFLFSFLLQSYERIPFCPLFSPKNEKEEKGTLVEFSSSQFRWYNCPFYLAFHSSVLTFFPLFFNIGLTV